MKHSTKLLTPAETLYKALSPSCQLQQRRMLSHARPFIPFGQRQPISPPEAAPRMESAHTQLLPGVQKKLAGYTLNKDIKSRWIQTRGAEGKLDEPQMLDTILASINPSSQVVRQLAAQGPTPDTAVVEVVEISQLLQIAAQRDQTMKEVKRNRKNDKAKQLELNWAISDNDLALKLKQMESFLDKGKTVEILLAAKKRQRKATEEEAQAVMRALRERIEGCGAKELKLEGKLLGQAMLTVQKRS